MIDQIKMTLSDYVVKCILPSPPYIKYDTAGCEYTQYFLSVVTTSQLHVTFVDNSDCIWGFRHV